MRAEEIEFMVEALALLRKFFDMDEEKVDRWLASENLNFGGSSPAYLMMNGKAHKVLAFVKASLDENAR